MKGSAAEPGRLLSSSRAKTASHRQRFLTCSDTGGYCRCTGAHIIYSERRNHQEDNLVPTPGLNRTCNALIASPLKNMGSPATPTGNALTYAAKGLASPSAR